MSWLTNYVRPKIRALVNKEDVPENLWHQCKSCEQMVFHRELEANHRVCPNCGNHMRLPCIRRMETIFDDGQYEQIALPETALDPLKFRDRKRYADRLKESRSSTGRKDAIVVGKGNMGGKTVVAAVFDFAFMGGSMGTAVGDAILEAANVAVAERAPLIIFPSSGGARMQEGILSLMQMPRTTIAVDQVKEAGLPYIVVLTDPTTGGVTASFAMLGDITIAEPGAVIGFAGSRVIEETIREKLPEGFQRAEYLLEHGMIDMVVPRHDMRATLIRVIDLLMNREAATEENTVVAIAPPEDPVEAEDIEERRAAE